MFWLVQPHQAVVGGRGGSSFLQATSRVPNGFPHSHPLRPRTMEERFELWLRWDWTQILIVGGAEGTEAQSSNWMRLKGPNLLWGI